MSRASGFADLPIALKNANDMLKDIVKAMDKNGDEVIQYKGMCVGGLLDLALLAISFCLPTRLQYLVFAKSYTQHMLDLH